MIINGGNGGGAPLRIVGTDHTGIAGAQVAAGDLVQTQKGLNFPAPVYPETNNRDRNMIARLRDDLVLWVHVHIDEFGQYTETIDAMRLGENAITWLAKNKGAITYAGELGCLVRLTDDLAVAVGFYQPTGLDYTWATPVTVAANGAISVGVGDYCGGGNEHALAIRLTDSAFYLLLQGSDSWNVTGNIVTMPGGVPSYDSNTKVALSALSSAGRLLADDTDTLTPVLLWRRGVYGHYRPAVARLTLTEAGACTVGTPLVVQRASEPYDKGVEIAILKMSDTVRLAVFYESSVGFSIVARACEVGENEITAGTFTFVAPLETNVTFYDACAMRLDDTRAVLMYHRFDSGTVSIEYRILSVSGTEVTAGEKLPGPAHPGTTRYWMAVSDMVDDRAVCAFSAYQSYASGPRGYAGLIRYMDYAQPAAAGAAAFDAVAMTDGAQGAQVTLRCPGA